MNTHINITLDMGETSKDLRIPLKISVKQLVMELDSIFLAVLKGVPNIN